MATVHHIPFLALALLVFTSALSAQTTRPTMHPDLEKATAEYRAKEYDACLATLKNFNAAQPAAAGIWEPNAIYSAHLEALAQFQSGRTGDATAGPLKRVVDSRKTNRSIAINTAVILLSEKEPSEGTASATPEQIKEYRAANAMHAALALKDYAVGKAPDEQIINLWGLALETVVTNSKDTPRLDSVASAWTRANAQLEATRPGMRRWGTQWMKKEDFARVDERHRTTQAAYDQAAAQLKAAEGEAMIANSIPRVTGCGPEVMSDSVRKRVQTNAAKGLARRQKEFKAAEAALIRPKWNVKLELVEPEFDVQ